MVNRKILALAAATIELVVGVPNGMPLNCRLRYDYEQPYMWKNVGTGFIYGLYDEPPATPEKCERCQQFGKDLADLNLFWMKVSKISGIWFDKSKIIEMEFFDMFDAFLNMYPIFSDYFEKLANVFTNKSALAIFDIKPMDVAGIQVATISDTLMSVLMDQLLPEVIVEDRKQKAGITTVFALMNSIPMSDCF